MSGQEYIVEDILQAKVAHKRKGKVAWKYLVKWKDYNEPEDNTWEPSESFTRGSQHFITAFWDTAWLDGRHRNDADSFKLHEVVFPTGPPAGRKVKKPRRQSEGDNVRDQASPMVVDSSDVGASEPEVESILGEKSSRSKSKRKLDSLDSRSPPKRGSPAKEAKAARKRSHRSSMPEKATRKTTAATASSSLSSKKRKFESPQSSEDESPVTVPLTKRGPPIGIKKSQKSKLNSEKEDQSNQNASLSSVTRDKTPPGTTDQNELTMESLFSSPVARTIERSTGLFSTIAADSEHESIPEIGSNKSKTPVPPATPVRHTSGLPSHRERAVNPRVKMIDDPSLAQEMKGAIAVKAKLGAQKPTPSDVNTFSTSSSSQHQRDSQPQEGLEYPSPGFLSSNSGNMEDTTGGEAAISNGKLPQFEIALEQATAQNLPDFEDEPIEVGTEVLTEDVIAPEATSKSVPPSITEKSASWSGRSTIFGPLARGFLASAAPLLDNSFLLNLDSSVSVPVVLKDVNPASSLDLPPLGAIITQTPRSPPGKFYRPESSVILDALKTGGPSARLSLKEGAIDKEKQHFDRFRERLQLGDIFVAMAGTSTIAIASSENLQVCEKLNVPVTLRGLETEAVISAVVIENHSVYAEAALLADDHRWL